MAHLFPRMKLTTVLWKGMSKDNLKQHRYSSSAAAIWKSAQAVCFDVDSTVCSEEGIDVLAAHCGQGQRVAAWTTKAMNGGVKFEDALAARLDIIKPSRKDIADCLRVHPPQLTPGIESLISGLHARNIHVYFVSGGFRLMIAPIADRLHVPSTNVFANTIHFDANGYYAGFDDTEMTSRDGGKPRVLEMLKKAHGYKTVVMVGDGVTDMQAKPPADLFVGFGGVVERDVVKKNADWFVKDFAELTQALP
ncbi:phosphoserine phosphatase SerB [Aphanomyces invadans]|uniref:phosphoserine phosphatase n=1 Tax=Aphanomyces invadans TaxID=157072 RepID=A0A024UR07_9STRA|nr:phosphoserine phosphatase SerB [Aphanomyces invadans]ETW08734.1 phosphoserine phosphatase SerB [Aphanomyces invadans]|eukprot:XP_008862539.1 phosphoserine phosphatase SerB [Aphanomyces invadans]